MSTGDNNDIQFNLTIGTTQPESAMQSTIAKLKQMGVGIQDAQRLWDKFGAGAVQAQQLVDRFNTKKATDEAGKLQEKLGLTAEQARLLYDVLDQDKGSKGLLQGQVAAQGLSRELGIELPRVVTRFLAQSEMIGPALTSAFGVIAVVGMVEALGQVPHEFDRLVGAITGWDEKSKQAYERFRADNQSAVESLTNFNAKMLEVGAPTAEAGQLVSLKYKIQEGENQLSPLVHRQAILHQKANDIRNGPMYLRGADGTDALAPTEFEGMGPRELDAAADSMREDLEKRRKAIQDLKDQYAALNKEIANKPGRAFGEDLQNFNETFMKSDARSNALAVAVNQAVAAHRSALDIINKFGKAMQDEETQAVKTGTAVNSAFLPFLATMRQTEEYTSLAKDIDAALAKMNVETDAQTNALVSAEASWQRWLLTMRQIPLGTAEARRQFETLNDLIEHNEQILQSSNRPGFLGGTILQHAVVPSAGINSSILNTPVPIGYGTHAPDPEDFKKWDVVGQNAINDITRSLERMLTDSIAKGQNFWTAFKNLGKDAVASITDFFFEHLIQGILDPWKQAIGKLVSGLGSSITNSV